MGEVLQFPTPPKTVWPMDRTLDSFGYPVEGFYDDFPVEPEETKGRDE